MKGEQNKRNAINSSFTKLLKTTFQGTKLGHYEIFETKMLHDFLTHYYISKYVRFEAILSTRFCTLVKTINGM